MAARTRESFVRALDLWRPPAGAGEPLICVATTFTFDAAFFETECLGRFLQMDTHPTESEPASYLVEREEKLASTRTVVLVDRQHAGEKESLRWDVLAVRPPKGVLHAKLSLLVWANAARVIVGSGNLTKPGYRENLEVFGTLDAQREEAGAVPLVLEAIGFLRELLKVAPGTTGLLGPKTRASEALSTAADRIRRWPRAKESNAVSLVFGSESTSVIDQFGKLWPGSSPARLLNVSAPFYEVPPKTNALATRLAGLLAHRGDREIRLDVRSELQPGGETLLRMSRDMVDAIGSTGLEVEVKRIEARQAGVDEDEPEVRPLHAKQFWLENDSRIVSMIGSSNCTSAGLGVGRRRNVEANLVYSAKVGSLEAKALLRVWPEVLPDPVNLDDKGLRWEPDFNESEEGLGDVLPNGFVDVLFSAEEPRELQIELGDDLPPTWVIRSESGAAVLTSAERTSSSASTEKLPWTEPGIPSVLLVSWRPELDKPERTAEWPVNVLDPAKLPPPEVLQNLTLEELIEALSSTRPIHESIRKLLARRKRVKTAADVELDPHKRVNTEEFLLRRLRRVAIALDRLKDRLERPVLSLEALGWRLRGPIGPLSLAEALRRDARVDGESAFFLAELVLMLGRVRPGLTAKGGLPESTIAAELSAVVSQVKAMVTVHSSGEIPASMAQYVSQAMATVKA